MSTLDYDKFDRLQLLQVMKEIPIELKKRDKTMRQDLRKRVQKMVEEAGYSLDDVLTTTKARVHRWAVVLGAAPAPGEGARRPQGRGGPAMELGPYRA